MAATLAVIGVAMQLIGVVLTGWGAWRTWHEFGSEPFWEFVIIPAHNLWTWVKTRIRRLFPRQPVTIRAGGATVGVTASVTGRGRVGFRAMPDDQSVEDSIAELDQRTHRILEQLQDTSERLGDQLKDLEAELGALRSEITHHVDDLRDSDRRVATSGIRLEAVGLFMIALGLVLQGLGSVLTPT